MVVYSARLGPPRFLAEVENKIASDLRLEQLRDWMQGLALSKGATKKRLGSKISVHVACAALDQKTPRRTGRLRNRQIGSPSLARPRDRAASISGAQERLGEKELGSPPLQELRLALKRFTLLGEVLWDAAGGRAL